MCIRDRIKVVPYVIGMTPGVPGAPEPRMYPRSGYFLVKYNLFLRPFDASSIQEGASIRERLIIARIRYLQILRLVPANQKRSIFY